MVAQSHHGPKHPSANSLANSLYPFFETQRHREHGERKDGEREDGGDGLHVTPCPLLPLCFPAFLPFKKRRLITRFQ